MHMGTMSLMPGNVNVSTTHANLDEILAVAVESTVETDEAIRSFLKGEPRHDVEA